MKLPRHIWADYDPTYPRDVRWAFYRTKAEQRDNRPDLPPIKLRIAAVRTPHSALRNPQSSSHV